MATSPDQIKDALRACETAGDVHRVSDQYRDEVKALAKTDKALALQISNLKAYRLWQIRNPV